MISLIFNGITPLISYHHDLSFRSDVSLTSLFVSSRPQPFHPDFQKAVSTLSLTIKDKAASKSNSLRNKPISMKLKHIVRTINQKKSKTVNGGRSSQVSPNTVSIEIEKTKEIGAEVGFRLDGAEDLLRSEIEGEGVNMGKQ
ncbi:hypothetical protein L2E82_20981 [Cichorium intybus]|uniref:Uncharacterized protein n=1 Tax=Cichorium intybus TaxID=13427 RepID=A0ACB9DUX0_CICIN|nr:hypothetical protein L2E82_20981 [Cichorium intybus]